MKDNIALIGFMGSGKSTIGKHLAKYLEMKFSDIDRIIAAKEKKSINEIFSEKGEIYFRDIEREIIAQESTKNNCVIATGGGSIVDNENLKNLSRTCFVVFLDCTLDCLFQRLKNSTSRPILNQNTDRFNLIKSLLESRKFLYYISSDYVVKIDSSTTIFETVEKIKKAYISS